MVGLFRRIRFAAIALVATLTVAAVAAPVAATGVVHGALVSETSRGNTPAFLDNEVRANLQVGNRIIVGGSFTQVDDDTFGVVNQPYLASYDLSTGRLDMNFRPVLDGTVTSLADAGDGTIIAVGAFNTVNGVTRRSTAKLNVVDGSVVTAFRANADAVVHDVAIANDVVYVGGSFNLVNAIARSKVAAVDLTTGAVATNFDFPITEPTGINGAGGVRALDVTPDGSTLVVGHNAHRVDGEVRQSIALIDIVGAPSLLPWRTDHYDYDCQPWFANFTRPLMRDLQVSPNGSFFVVVTSIGNYAPGCDVAVKFPVAGGAGTVAEWVSRLFDTPEAVAISDQAIYIGGHFRWLQDAGTVWTDWQNGNTNTQPANTVVRDQIGALDIATGTALAWDPGATGIRGVLALRVAPAGLLVGSDGQWIGGRQVGRHGLLELPDSGSNDNTDPVATISSPLAGQVVGNVVSFSGTASDNVGLADVLLSVQNRDTGQFMQLDGTFNNGGWQLHRTFVPNAFTPSSSWLWTATLPDGNYRITARADDLAGNRGSAVRVDFAVGTIDTVDPNGTLATPKHKQVLTTTQVTFNGAAIDNVSVKRVSLIIRNRDTGDYLQPDGTFAPSSSKVTTTLANPGNFFTTWTWSGTIPDGRYRLKVHVKDAAGNSDPDKARADFVIES